MNSLTVIAADRTGVIAELAGLLGSNGINIAVMDGRVIGTAAILHIDVDDLPLAVTVLTRAGCQVMAETVLTLRVENVPGALVRVARELSEATIDIRMMRTVSRQSNNCLVTIATSDNERARQLLADRVV
ncbi:ACT domain-containing protein [Paraburkholderia humisilvae]|uniref:ACT domain-containing protein n=1 Tax=Paraburkholderia humisilvae TaxID=627669 RepID=A0A6J5F8N1_9BURK|nr:ACT domain-containing protein [Paraburkholderia humisilvae]CAB3774002.1 hypothetical protein LMG29542_07554 [Paraburkholderia humisilvae]